MNNVRAAERYDSRNEDEFRANVESAVSTLESQPNLSFISGDRGDANVTLTNTDLEVQRFATTLTANRTVTLPQGYSGAKFTIVRTGLGAFTLDVGPGIKTIPSATAAFVDVGHSGAGWILVRYGTL